MMGKAKKRRGFAIPALAVLALVLAACGANVPSNPTRAATRSVSPTLPAETSLPTTPPPTSEDTRPAPTRAAASGSVDCMGAAQGDPLSILYQWSGIEGQMLAAVLQPLADACGIVLQLESSLDPGLLAARVQAGTPPDAAIWNLTQARPFAGQLKTMQELGVRTENYAQAWQTQGTVGGRWVGLPVKADVKSLVWYSPANFKAHGYQVPTTWNELNALVEKMAADGLVPWSMGFGSPGADGWTGSDWIEDILLVKQGPGFVRGLIDGSRSYDDPAVREAYHIYHRWAADSRYTVDGAQGTLSIHHHDAIYNVFANPPKAMMVRQGGFSGSLIAARYPDLKFGTDVDFFLFPGIQAVQTGADWMMAFNDKPAVKALFAYLSSPAGAQAWPRQKFDISPNLAARGAYTDPALDQRAEILYAARDSVPDIGDTLSGGFAAVEWRGIVDDIKGGDLGPILASIAAAQKAALQGSQAAPAGTSGP